MLKLFFAFSKKTSTFIKREIDYKPDILFMKMNLDNNKKKVGINFIDIYIETTTFKYAIF